MNTIETTYVYVTANKNGCILTDYKGTNTASFLAKLPKSAVVDHIKVDGFYLDDINTKEVKYHVDLVEKTGDELWRVIATVKFEEDDLDFYDRLANYVVQDFEIFYHLESVVYA